VVSVAWVFQNRKTDPEIWTVLSPKAGEVWVLGESHFIVVAGPQPVGPVHIYLEKWSAQENDPVVWFIRSASTRYFKSDPAKTASIWWFTEEQKDQPPILPGKLYRIVLQDTQSNLVGKSGFFSLVKPALAPDFTDL